LFKVATLVPEFPVQVTVGLEYVHPAAQPGNGAARNKAKREKTAEYFNWNNMGGASEPRGSRLIPAAPPAKSGTGYHGWPAIGTQMLFYMGNFFLAFFHDWWYFYSVRVLGAFFEEG
jgi:hypothetical protein